jgi:hypothetical protein
VRRTPFDNQKDRALRTDQQPFEKLDEDIRVNPPRIPRS